MKICTVNSDYLKYLHAFDKRVEFSAPAPDAYNSSRPYTGSVLASAGSSIGFYAPFEHPRKKHAGLKKNMHIIKIYDGRLGLISLNNMIPVPSGQLTEIKTDESDSRIIREQYKFCIRFENLIRSRAELIYAKSRTMNSFEKNVFCDFRKLEFLALQYGRISPFNSEYIQILLHEKHSAALLRKKAV